MVLRYLTSAGYGFESTIIRYHKRTCLFDLLETITCERYEAISINVTLKKSVSSVKNWRKNADGRWVEAL